MEVVLEKQQAAENARKERQRMESFVSEKMKLKMKV